MSSIIGDFLKFAMEADDDDPGNTNVIGAVQDGPGNTTSNTNTSRGVPSNTGATVPRNAPAEPPPSEEEGNEDAYADDSGDIDMDDGGDAENPDENMTMDEDEIPEQDSSETALRNRLKENMIILYRIIDHEIEVLQDFIARNNITEENKILFRISSNLRDLKTILFNQITIGFESKSYENLTKTYVAISKIYDIALKMLMIQYEDPSKSKNSLES